MIALGGALGAVARYGLAVLLPTQPGHFPLATFLTNVSGCFLIGILMVAVTEAWTAHRLVRPFLGIGILGGYTTFSTYTVEIRGLLDAGEADVALGYLAATLVAALPAVALGMALARLAFVRRERAVRP
ncbi:fluoride efflux transporter CrcB [Amycolatopsis sp. FDAARGOS 1241]|nr:fluoride efflux transporter CrcB [Amycolatopsis sp. FDAARGOS 1241]QRP50812.1 fluoride efflux transporter CrcB [Amycolatopsis sp. FDAARGOS 1241]